MAGVKGQIAEVKNLQSSTVIISGILTSAIRPLTLSKRYNLIRRYASHNSARIASCQPDVEAWYRNRF